MTELRAIRPDEWSEALRLWEEVFGVGQWLFDSLHQSTANRKWEQVRVAVEDGRIIAAVDVFLRQIRDEHGVPQLVGGVGSVATRPEARRRGLSRDLLGQLIDQMELEGCAWSLLFTGSFDHYAPLGWKRLAIRSMEARLKSVDFAVSPEVGLVPDPWPLAEMAELYDAFNETRPLTAIRTDLIWSISIRVRLERPERFCLGRYRDGHLAGYLVATQENGRTELEEIAAHPTDQETVDLLLDAYFARAKSAGIAAIQSMLPDAPIFENPLADRLENIRIEPSPWLMARPISPTFGSDRIEAVFNSPGATFYRLDQF